MLKDITLGQYFPGNTVIHRLDPRTKIWMVIFYIVALFTAKWFVSYAVMLVFLIVAVRISKVAVSTILRGMKPLIIIIILTGLLNIFYTQGEPLVKVWIFTITKEGILNAFFMIIRILMLVTGTFLLTYTTSPIALTDALEIMLSPLKKIKVPVHELSMMMCIALRFIPTLIEETDKIISAQKARGADFHFGAVVYQRIPSCGRAGGGHGVSLLPWRRGKNQNEATPLWLAGWRHARNRIADDRRSGCTAAIWAVKRSEYAKSGVDSHV